MDKVRNAVYTVHRADAPVKNSLHPLAKLLVTVCYIMTVVSFDKYDLEGLAGMVIYLLILFTVWDIHLRRCIGRLRPVLLLVCMVGIANPFLDRSPLGTIGGVVVTGGMVSMLTLMLKGVFSVLASYVLISTTGMERICYALRCLRIPKDFVTVLLLIYRYIIVLLKEVERMGDAYRLRAPGQKGIQMRAWGSFAGQLLLRSMDRAETVYESMVLRGYDGEFRDSGFDGKILNSVAYFIFFAGGFLLLRYVPIFRVVGNILL